MDSPYTIHILNYNHDPGELLHALLHQMEQYPRDVRLWLWDDGSDAEYRDRLLTLKSLHQRDNIIWRLEDENTGRSSMRQKILEQPPEGWMVSLDSDMAVDDEFVIRMISDLNDHNAVYAGRHEYQEIPPAAEYLLHWNYGKMREVKASSKNPYHHFSTAIFAWHSSIASGLLFTPEISGYGHEDTLFGLGLEKKHLNVKPAGLRGIHLGLSTHEIFIEKQLSAVRNLSVVMDQFPDYRNALVKWGRRVQKIPLVRPILSSGFVRQLCLSRLRKDPSKLFYLDLLKLNEWLRNS